MQSLLYNHDLFKDKLTNGYLIVDEAGFISSDQMDKLFKISEKYKTAFWEKIDENSSAIRICTSWATTDENTDRLIEDIILYLGQE